MRLVLLWMVVMSLGGCIRVVHSPEKPNEHDARLGWSQNSDGDVTLTWDSRKDYIYRLYMMDENRFWRRVEKSPDYIGTGEKMSITKKTRSDKELPLYSVRGIKAKKNAHKR